MRTIPASLVFGILMMLPAQDTLANAIKPPSKHEAEWKKKMGYA